MYIGYNYSTALEREEPSVGTAQLNLEDDRLSEVTVAGPHFHAIFKKLNSEVTRRFPGAGEMSAKRYIISFKERSSKDVFTAL